MKAIPFKIVIPARYASTRLPGKPLLDLGGKPMVVRVAERARLAGAAFYRLGQAEVLYPVAELKARWAGRTLHAVAGIGHPERFFATLAGLGLACTAHPFPDHHAYTQGDLDFGADAVVLMTEKDAVKCRHLNLGETWVLPVTAELPPALVEIILEKMSGRPAS